MRLPARRPRRTTSNAPRLPPALRGPTWRRRHRCRASSGATPGSGRRRGTPCRRTSPWRRRTLRAARRVSRPRTHSTSRPSVTTASRPRQSRHSPSTWALRCHTSRRRRRSPCPLHQAPLHASRPSRHRGALRAAALTQARHCVPRAERRELAQGPVACKEPAAPASSAATRPAKACVPPRPPHRIHA